MARLGLDWVRSGPITEEYARAVAAETDRVALAVHPVARPLVRDIVARAGLTAGTGVLVPLLTPLLAGPLTVGDGHAIVRYTPRDEFLAALDSHLATGMLARLDDGHYTVTADGRRLLERMRAVQGAAISELWQPAADSVGRLLPLAERLVAAGWETAGTAYAVMAGSPDPLAATPAHLLLTRVTALRYHRADDHAAAWRAAGLTAAQFVALPDGPRREEIERDTDRRAAAPYASLTEGERAVWLDGLRTLPG